MGLLQELFIIDDVTSGEKQINYNGFQLTLGWNFGSPRSMV